MKVKIMKRTGSAILALSMLAGGAAAMLPVTAESSIEVRAADSYKTFGDFKYVVSHMRILSQLRIIPERVLMS